MDTETPTWMTKEFLEEVLAEGAEGGKVTVDDFEVRSAVPKGNNYVCDILRVKINHTTGREGSGSDGRSEKSLIFKVPKTGGMSEWIMQMGIIQREMGIYKVLVPRLCEIYGENVFTARSYRSTVENLLILDDLNSIGYKMADRRKQLDLEECRVALKTLARFHGASVKYHEEDPKYIEGFDDLLFCERFRKAQPDFVTGMFGVGIEEVSKLPGCTKYADKLLEYKENADEILVDLFTPKDTNFNVLNHGDFWATNMLFKYDEAGKPIDVKLIDLQASRYNSPAVDLAYFFTSSVQEETRTKHYDELLSGYLKELNATLELVGVEKRLEMERLKSEIKQFYLYELFVAVNALPMFLCNPEDAFDAKDITMEEMMKLTQSDLFRMNFKTGLFRTAITKLMSELEEKGLF